MEWIFQDVPPARETGSGVLRVASADDASVDPLRLALGVASLGWRALRAGQGVPTLLSLPRDPTLDDLLAASWAQRTLAGQAIPSGAGAFARYVGMVREGLRPGSGPAESSLEAIFLAIRSEVEDLEDGETRRRFLERWRVMESVIWEAAETGVDPFADDVFKDHPAFARERAFLRDDHRVYDNDLAKAVCCVAHVPGSSGRMSALVLHEPRSIHFKHWARTDPRAPVGGGYLLLAVRNGPGQWVFSTDPVVRTSIAGLAAALQKKEARRDPAGAVNDPWFDGRPFQGTLVASPRAGSVLSDREIEKSFLRWARARPVAEATRLSGRRAAMGAIALVVVVGGGGAWWHLAGRGPDFDARGEVLPDHVVRDLRSTGAEIGRFALVVGVGKSSYGPLPAAVPDAARIYRMLTELYRYPRENVLLLVDEPERAVDRDGKPLPVFGPPDRETLSRAIDRVSTESRRYPKDDITQFLFYFGGHGHVVQAGEEIGYLVLGDSWEQRDKRPLDVTGYDMVHLQQDLVRRIQATHQLVLVDACFSGFAIQGRGDYRKEPWLLRSFWKRRATVVLTSGTSDQQSWEVDGESLFGGAVVRALGGDGTSPAADTNRDGIITDGELAAFVRKDVEARSGKVRPQTPMYYRGLVKDDVGQFLFFR